MLSDEQMSCVSGAGVGDWSEVVRPTGSHPLPDWVKDAHIDWMDGCGNAPDVRIKAIGSVYRWPDQRFEKIGKAYIARHPDGRVAVHYHDGAVSTCCAYRILVDGKPTAFPWKIADKGYTETSEKAAHREADKWMANLRTFHDKKGLKLEAEFKTVQATTQQDGFGGSYYWLTMIDGSELVLRGPWHGGAPEGYVEVGTVDVTGPYFATGWSRGKRWYKRTGGPSVYLTEELYLRIVARYCPHAPIARVQRSYGTRLEPFRAEWGCPKSFIYELELERNRRKEPAGPFWRVYWDGTNRYCGSLRMPTHGFQEGVAA